MGELLSAFLAFPTVIWSILLVVAMVYWAFVFLGALDIELFDVDGDVDADLDLDADAPGIDAVHHEVDTGDGHGGSAFGRALSATGLTGVPVMISMSFLILYAWGLSMVGSQALPWVQSPGLVGTVTRFGVFVGSFCLAVPLAAFSIRPFRRLFKTHKAIRRHALVGRTCRVTTQSVTGDFGQAEIDERGATYLVQVRCPRTNDLGKDSEAIIYDYDPGDEVFHIAPVDDVKQIA